MLWSNVWHTFFLLSLFLLLLGHPVVTISPQPVSMERSSYGMLHPRLLWRGTIKALPDLSTVSFWNAHMASWIGLIWPSEDLARGGESLHYFFVQTAWLLYGPWPKGCHFQAFLAWNGRGGGGGIFFINCQYTFMFWESCILFYFPLLSCRIKHENSLTISALVWNPAKSGEIAYTDNQVKKESIPCWDRIGVEELYYKILQVWFTKISKQTKQLSLTWVFYHRVSLESVKMLFLLTCPFR